MNRRSKSRVKSTLRTEHAAPYSKLLSLLPAVTEMYSRAFSGVVSSPEHLRNMCHDSLNPDRSREQLANIERHIGRSLKNLKTLEVGAGLGLTMSIGRIEFGAETYGIEPGEEEYQSSNSISHQLLESFGIDPGTFKRGVGEQLPFPDESFDLVYSNNVLEHVNNPQRVIDECVRVLKPGGTLFIVVPNYGSWWEGHYGVLMMPHMPRWAFKIYVRLLRRNPKFADTLQFVTHGKLQRWLGKHRDCLDVRSYGQDLWEYRMRSLDFSNWSALAKLKRILRVIDALRMKSLAIVVGKLLHWETPFNVLAEKRFREKEKPSAHPRS